MKYERISDKVKDIIETSKGEVKLRDGSTFNHHDTIKRIYLYSNDQFYNPENNDDVFWNIASSRSVHFAKNLDLDTKDLMPYGIGETNFLQAWITRVKLRQWLDESDIAEKLDDLSDGVSDFGSHIWKIVDGEDKLQEPDLRNIYFDPTAKTIRGIDKVEKHFLTREEIEAKGWDNEEKILEEEPEGGKYEIWEFTGTWKGEWKNVIGKGFGESELIAFEEDIKEDDDPYYDSHLGKYKGRWLRVGVYERLFKLQERANKLVNENAKTTEIASLLLLVSENPEANGNVFTSLVSGDILADSTLKQVALQNPGISTFFNEMALIERQADKLCLTPDVVVGEQSPSNIPFRSLATLTNAAKSAFKKTRDRIAEPLTEILIKHILPDILKDWNKESILEISEDDADVQLYDEAVKNAVAKEAMLSGKLVTPEFMQSLEFTVADEINKVGRKINIPKGFFDFKFGIRFNITGESFDKQQQNDAMFNALQMIQVNPALINISLFKQYLENNGISWWKLTPKQMQEIQSNIQANPQGQQPLTPKKDALMAQVDS